jgi:hypothetical protein
MKSRSPFLLAACASALLATLAGCAGYDGGSLLPGQSSAAEVERVMGPVAEKRATAGGETILWFPRLPYGRVSYAARISKDDRLIAVEQRLTRENFDRLRPGASRAGEVRDLLGPPQRVDPYPRMQREVWTYQAQGMEPQLMVVQLSADGVVREAYMFNDPEFNPQQSAD